MLATMQNVVWQKSKTANHPENTIPLQNMVVAASWFGPASLRGRDWKKDGAK